jgi:hypothetical protein
MKERRILFFMVTVVILPSAEILHAQDHGDGMPQVHSMNAPMGIPDPVGHYNVRFGHLSYGLFEWGGIHLRSLGVRTTPLTEVIGMVGVWETEERSQGISLLGILGIPTGKKDGDRHHGLSYLFGIAGRWQIGSRVVNDIVFHYDATAMHWILESGTAMKSGEAIYGIIDTRITIGGVAPEILILPALKVQITRMLYAGIGYNVPLTAAKPFRNQIYLQLELTGGVQDHKPNNKNTRDAFFQ